MCHGLFNIFQSHNNNHISQSLFHFVTLWFHCRRSSWINSATIHCTCQLYLSHKQEIFTENAGILLENPMTSKGALNHEPTINIDLIVPLRRLKEGLPPAEIAVKINAWPGVILKVQLSKESQVDLIKKTCLAFPQLRPWETILLKWSKLLLFGNIEVK